MFAPGESERYRAVAAASRTDTNIRARIAFAALNATPVREVDFRFEGESLLRQLPLPTQSAYVLALDSAPVPLSDGAREVTSCCGG